MRTMFLLIFLCGVLLVPIKTDSLYQAVSNKEPYSVTLRGRADLVDLKSTSSSGVMLSVKLTLELLNNGVRPVILLAAKPPMLVGAALAKSPADFTSGKNLVLEYYGPAVDTSPEWGMLRKSLDQASPPSDKVRILMPNESLFLEDSASFALPTESGKNSFIPKRESWDVIRKASPVWFRAICQVWPLNLEPSSRDRTKLVFGQKLRRRWKESGFLWLDHIYTVPIQIDLRDVSQRQ